MSGSEKGSSFLDPLRPHSLLQLADELHSRPLLQELDTRRNQSTSPKLPLKLPQRRKFFTLMMHNSADSDVDSSRNSPASDTEITWTRSTAQEQYQEALDLRTILAADTKLDMAMEGGQLPGEEQILEKKKLLAQLTGMNIPVTAGKSKAFYQGSQAFHESLKGFRESSVSAQSNPCRVCRFCGREFPSGRALGGHMRVHGALLDAQISNMKQEKQERNQLYAGKQQHEEKLGSKAQNSVSGPALDLSASKVSDEREESSEEIREKNSEDRQGASYLFMDRIHQKGEVDADCRQQTIQREENLPGPADVSYLEYSAGYGFASKMDSVHIPGVETLSKKHSALYELRRNPKPNQRFMNKDDQYVAQIMNPLNAISRSNQSLSELPASAEDMPVHSPETAHPCSECGKVFSSWKALFGHMRCHPEREWRGIQRPDSSGELDRTARMTARRPSAEGSIELGFNEGGSKSNCMKVEIPDEIAHSDQGMRADYSKSKCTSTKGMMHSPAEEQMASRANGEVRMSSEAALQASTIDLDSFKLQLKEKEQGNKNQSSNKYKLHESAMEHSNDLEEMTDDWTPIWSAAGKRSKRRRMISHMAQLEPTLTSETTSNEIKWDGKGEDNARNQEELDMANCLVLLSTAGKSMQEVNKVESTEESAHSYPSKVRRAFANADRWEQASDDGVENPMHDDTEAEDQNIGGDDEDDDDDQAKHNADHTASMPNIKYQCSTCKKCFNSHQALGGHRASHRKMKGCFARMKSLAAYGPPSQESSEENIDTEEPEYNITLQRKKGQILKHPQQDEKASMCADFTNKSGKKKFKGHECSICHRVFVTGQALGGHKRCHWTGEKVPPAVGGDAASVASSSTDQNRHQTSAVQDMDEWGCRSNLKAKEDVFDLNLPAPVDEDDEVGLDAACGALMNGGAGLRPPVWPKQEWNPTKVANIPQVCSVKTL